MGMIEKLRDGEKLNIFEDFSYKKLMKIMGETIDYHSLKNPLFYLIIPPPYLCFIFKLSLYSAK